MRGLAGGEMKCYKCHKRMPFVKGMKFNEYKLDGWRCSCGEIYYEPVQAERILLLNKLKKAKMKAKLGRIRSNLILRLPKDIEFILGLKQGGEVLLEIEGNRLKISPV